MRSFEFCDLYKSWVIITVPLLLAACGGGSGVSSAGNTASNASVATSSANSAYKVQVTSTLQGGAYPYSLIVNPDLTGEFNVDGTQVSVGLNTVLSTPGSSSSMLLSREFAVFSGFINSGYNVDVEGEKTTSNTFLATKVTLTSPAAPFISPDSSIQTNIDAAYPAPSSDFFGFVHFTLHGGLLASLNSYNVQTIINVVGETAPFPLAGPPQLLLKALTLAQRDITVQGHLVSPSEEYANQGKGVFVVTQLTLKLSKAAFSELN